MASPDWRVSILTLPQLWDSASRRIGLRALILPRGNPLEPLLEGVPFASDEPAFVDARISFDIQFIPNLRRMPDPADVQVTQTAAGGTPADLRALYGELAKLFPLAAPGVLAAPKPRRAGTHIRKYLPSSYCGAFAFEQPRTPFAVMDDTYLCALRTPPAAIVPPPPFLGMSWGQILAAVLAQPRLAERLGLIYALSLDIPAAIDVMLGGWLYVTLTSGSPYASLVAPAGSNVKLYAARIPPLDAAKDRVLFAPVLFPVPAPPVSFDENLIEAASYDDGFVKIVHCAQPTNSDLLDNSAHALPPVQDAGIQLGWEDEQVIVWMNRQADPAQETQDSPMGVGGFRVDVRAHVDVPLTDDDASWTSLARVEGDLELGAFHERFTGEHALRVAPAQLHGLRTGDFWLPPYFAQWNGKSLVIGDDFVGRVSGESPRASPFRPVGVGKVALQYGKSYDFRVRLADISGGGPSVDMKHGLPGEAPIAMCRFRRFVPPKAVRIADLAAPDPLRPQTSYQIHRPVLGYPALVYTGFPNAEQALIADVPTAKAERREVGLPDLDVTTLEIQVAVRDPGLDGDVAFRTLYTANRKFPEDAAAGLTLTVGFEHVHDVAALPAPGDLGPLPLPTARDVRLTLTPLCRDDPRLEYFGSQEARRGRPVVLDTRAHSSDERGLFAAQTPAEEFHVHMLQPDPVPSAHLSVVLASDGRQQEAPADLVHRLARASRTEARGLTFFGKTTRRTVFACSSNLRHMLSAEHSAITFASRAELTGHWIAVLSLVLDRDWTWDALADSSLQVQREVRQVQTGVTETSLVGTIEVPRGVSPQARAKANPAVTRIVFFDGVDPKPPAGAHPSELEITYTLTPSWKSTPVDTDRPFTAKMDLPIAAPPLQTPKLASAGIALSPYKRATDYSSSEARRRMLWLEFTEPVANIRDALFVRVLAYAPDPMLTGLEPQQPPAPAEPPLSFPEELIRTITRGQPADDAGLDDMGQEMIRSDSPRHFFVPLPNELSSESSELFGFFVCELRVGHRGGWSTATARPGPPLRATGIQHPAPPIRCETVRRPAGISASSIYAMPVLEGRNLLPSFPLSEIWHLLYAQVVQVDGEDQRNVLLGRKRAQPMPQQSDAREKLEAGGVSEWMQGEIDLALRALNLPRKASLSVLAVEMLPELDRKPDPLGADLGHVRILRTSPLTPVGEICL